MVQICNEGPLAEHLADAEKTGGDKSAECAPVPSHLQKVSPKNITLVQAGHMYWAVIVGRNIAATTYKSTLRRAHSASVRSHAPQ